MSEVRLGLQQILRQTNDAGQDSLLLQHFIFSTLQVVKDFALAFTHSQRKWGAAVLLLLVRRRRRRRQDIMLTAFVLVVRRTLPAPLLPRGGNIIDSVRKIPRLFQLTGPLTATALESKQSVSFLVMFYGRNHHIVQQTNWRVNLCSV
jgi:hypothetical protein